MQVHYERKEKDFLKKKKKKEEEEEAKEREAASKYEYVEIVQRQMF